MNKAIPYAPVIVSVLVVCGFISAVFLLMTLQMTFTTVAGQAFLVLVGVLATSFTQVVHYWLGSSANSDKAVP